MNHEWYVYVLLVLASLFAGFVNTLTGSGSLVTMSALLFAGLPAHAANATNRLGVLLQSLVGTIAFYKNNKFDYRTSTWFIVPSVIGAIAGAWLAVDIDEQTLETCIGLTMLALLFVVVIKPEKWLRTQSEAHHHRTLLNLLIFLGVGFYGGFLQAGVGILLLVALVLGAKYTLKESNALKVMIVFLFTIPALAVFIFSGQIDWILGSIMAAAQSIGAWVAAHFANNHPKANLWVRRMLIAVILVSVVQLLHIVEWIQKLIAILN